MTQFLQWVCVKFYYKKQGQNGVSAIEFIFAFPVVLLLFIFFADVNTYFVLKQKNARQSFIMVDLLSTQPSLSFVNQLNTQKVNRQRDIKLINTVLQRMGNNLDDVAYTVHWIDLFNPRLRKNLKYKGGCGNTKTDIKNILPNSPPLKVNGSIIAIDFCRTYKPNPYIFYKFLLPNKFQSSSVAMYRGLRSK